MSRVKQRPGPHVASRKNLDPILAAVLAEIHKSAETPPKGFMKAEDWATRWKLAEVQARAYLAKAVASGLLVERIYRVITHGRLRKMSHYGPPPRK